MNQSAGNNVYSTETLMPKVYDELRRLAQYKMNQERSGQSISGTVLVHEAYLRLSKEKQSPQWVTEKQFFSAAAEAMRRILIERIRTKNAIKRGGDQERVDLPEIDLEMPAREGQLLAVDEALNELEQVDPEAANLVKLRFFAGLTLEEIAKNMGVSVRTVTRHWTYAKAWLSDYLSEDI